MPRSSPVRSSLIRSLPARSPLSLCGPALACALVAGTLAGCAPSRQIVALGELSGRPHETATATAITPSAAPTGAAVCRADAFPQERVYFDTDKSVLRPDAQRILTGQADWLRGCSATRLRIEGNADERGTRDYNLALGERRALAVKAFLVEHGVAAARIETISYGKDQPISRTYAQNRNGHMVILDAAP